MLDSFDRIYNFIIYHVLFFRFSMKVNLESDILSVAALANAYATCHNVQDLLYFRGFSSKPAHAKRGKKGGKPRPKKKGAC